ncbi:hypothetical protein LX15_002052 [Streptoalloteichus tenebrarius]|uniref:Uncharacterized protein n=1 Tax=Streptoalloteichus tenebrarius (strain ATCC 17920 / DSM 40477 / JCM 4838 / CBS 697.72 / NBRC 16177 / NCIMB 11028 / NRRL B-12390 / A12253. 1 / ISP 5477) TaxID=1933 RepID=A0ABT1HS59_STRSD|nr:hypothetical protein [Streptoalloteichus tenebrarius]MCP2258358.1 hypothetical protein [Streptoalloteichus tenebrarius]BFF03525.1 hypothetical protein GCM10020241_52000 [Streptoalloteichus tenebrarius]
MATTSALVRISLGSFVDYSVGTGSMRITTVMQQRRLYDNPTVFGLSFYPRIINAIRAGRASNDDHAALAPVVEAARPAQRPHYEAVAEGWLECVRRWKPEVVPVGSTRWRRGELDLGITPHLGLRERDGSTHVVFLYVKERPLTRDGASVALRLMERHRDVLLPGAEPLVIDVRRRRHHRLPARVNRAKLDAWIDGEAAAYVTHWSSAAVA